MMQRQVRRYLAAEVRYGCKLRSKTAHMGIGGQVGQRQVLVHLEEIAGGGKVIARRVTLR